MFCCDRRLVWCTVLNSNHQHVNGNRKLLRAEVRIHCDKFLKYTLKLFTVAVWAVKVFVNDLETEPKFWSMRRLENVKIKFYGGAHDWPIIIIIIIMVCETLFRFSLVLTVGSDADIERTRLRNRLIIILIFLWKKSPQNSSTIKDFNLYKRKH